MNFLKIARKSQEQSNFYYLVTEIAWFGLALPAVDRFLAVYAIHLGADATQLTWLQSLPALVLLISASLGDWWMRRSANSVKAVFWPGIGFRLIFLLPALTPFLPHDFQITWLILSLALPAFPQGIASVAFLVMIRESVNENKVPTLLGRRFMALNLTVGLSGLALGVWLERVAFPLNYQLMFVTAFAITLISVWHITRVRALPALVAPPTPVKTPRSSAWRSPAFQTVAFVVLITHISFFSIKPLIPLHLVHDLGASEGFIGQFALAELIAGALVTMATPFLIERIGNRKMLAVAMAGAGISTLMISTLGNLYLILIAAAVGGAAWTMVQIGVFAFFSEMTPVKEKSVYTTAYNQVVFLSIFIGPIIGKLLSNTGMPLVTIILVGAMLRLLASILTQMHPRAWYARAVQLASLAHTLIR